MSHDSAIREFLVSEFLPDMPEGGIPEDFNLIDNGVIDSLGLLKVIAWIESRFGMSVDVTDMVPENFNSVGVISAFLERMQRTPTHAAGHQLDITPY
jgi:acyl carrier protein